MLKVLLLSFDGVAACAKNIEQHQGLVNTMV